MSKSYVWVKAFNIFSVVLKPGQHIAIIAVFSDCSCIISRRGLLKREHHQSSSPVACLWTAFKPSDFIVILSQWWRTDTHTALSCASFRQPDVQNLFTEPAVNMINCVVLSWISCAWIELHIWDVYTMITQRLFYNTQYVSWYIWLPRNL